MSPFLSSGLCRSRPFPLIFDVFYVLRKTCKICKSLQCKVRKLWGVFLGDVCWLVGCFNIALRNHCKSALLGSAGFDKCYFGSPSTLIVCHICTKNTTMEKKLEQIAVTKDCTVQAGNIYLDLPICC